MVLVMVLLHNYRLLTSDYVVHFSSNFTSIKTRPFNGMELPRVCVNVFLFVLYVYCFGSDSIKKYFQGGVIITRHTDKKSYIDPPGYQLIYGPLVISINYPELYCML